MFATAYMYIIYSVSEMFVLCMHRKRASLARTWSKISTVVEASDGFFFLLVEFSTSLPLSAGLDLFLFPDCSDLFHSIF